MGKINQKDKPKQQLTNRTINGKPNKKYPSTSKKNPIQKRNFVDKSNKSQLKKKDKVLNKRKNLITKMNLIKKQHLVEIKRKRREKTAITGDLKQLKDALPSLDELFKLPRNDIKTGIKCFDNIGNTITENKNNKKNKRTEFMNRYKCFTSLLNNKDYKNNPRGTIDYHIQNTMNEN